MAFYNETDDISNFVISFTKKPKDDFGEFARGYFHAASTIATELLSRGRFPDYEAYPVVFLCRHALELYLKNIIYKAVLLSALKYMDDIDSKLYNDHRLVLLSKKAAAVLKKLFPGDKEIRCLSEKILKISQEFSDIDPRSFSYRYPINRQGNYSTKPHQIVNLNAFFYTMYQLFEELEGVDFGIDIETSIAEDIYEILDSVLENYVE